MLKKTGFRKGVEFMLYIRDFVPGGNVLLWGKG
jgi:hypothetical protein